VTLRRERGCRTDAQTIRWPRQRRPGCTLEIGPATLAVTVATFSDANTAAPAADFTAATAWGDGSTTTVIGGGIAALGKGNFAVLGSHNYAEDGTYTLSVQVSDVGGASISNSRIITVADAALRGLSLTNPNSEAGQDTGTYTVATFHDANLAAPTADFTAVIQWGDGTTTTVTGGNIVALGGGDFAVLSDHAYAASGAIATAARRCLAVAQGEKTFLASGSDAPAGR
jgi:hypothetical protein